MHDSATNRRNLAAGSLLAAAALSAVSVVLQPAFDSGYAERLATIEDAGGTAIVSAVAFVVAQLPMMAAMLAIAHLLRERAPRLSAAGATLGVLGAFGHAVIGGVNMTWLVMAADKADRATYAGLMEQVDSSPIMAFGALGLLGTVLGILLLSIGLWRARVEPRWVAPLLWLFLVVEFVGTGLSEYASAASAVLFLIAFGALARTVWTSPRAAWTGDLAGIDAASSTV